MTRKAGRKGLFFSPLTKRILAVNTLALLIPVIGLLYLGPYRNSLIEQELENMRGTGMIFSGALGEGAISLVDGSHEILSLQPAQHIVRRLAVASHVRARLFLTNGRLIADSSRIEGYGGVVRVEELPEPGEEHADDVFGPLERMMDEVAGLVANQQWEQYREKIQATAKDYPEVLQAMNGEIGAVVRKDQNGRLVLSVAFPVQRYYKVFGALMISKSGHEIEAALAKVRSTIFLIFAATLVITTLLSIYLARTIVRPVHRLAEAADQVRQTMGQEQANLPDLGRRQDEIGDLSLALRDMTEALHTRMNAIEAFAADVAHELKNPLSSLRSAVETASRITDPDQQKKLMSIIQDDVARLDRLISDISDASRLDAEMSRAMSDDVNLSQMLETLSELHNTVAEDKEFAKLALTRPEEPVIISGLDSRLVQVFQNLFANAASFAPADSVIAVTMTLDEGDAILFVDDSGPGLPEGKLDAIFNRFYSERPASEKFGMHSGLGLSISKQIMEAHQGSIHAENRYDDEGHILGARFVLRIPLKG